MPTKTVKPVPTVTGRRVYLRPFVRSDAAAMIRLTNQSARRYPGVMRRFKGKAQFEEFRKSYDGESAFGFMICRQEDGEPVGSIGLFHIVRRNTKTAFVGYSIGAPHMRQGYATEALQLMLKFAFRKLRLHRVEASIQPHNAPSIATVKRAGFTYEGCSRRLVKIAGQWRDHERWSILADEWSGRHRQ